MLCFTELWFIFSISYLCYSIHFKAFLGFTINLFFLHLCSKNSSSLMFFLYINDIFLLLFSKNCRSFNVCIKLFLSNTLSNLHGWLLSNFIVEYSCCCLVWLSYLVIPRIIFSITLRCSWSVPSFSICYYPVEQQLNLV